MVRSPWQSFKGRGKSNLGKVKVSTGTVSSRQKSTRSQEKQSTEENETPRLSSEEEAYEMATDGQAAAGEPYNLRSGGPIPTEQQSQEPEVNNDGYFVVDGRRAQLLSKLYDEFNGQIPSSYLQKYADYFSRIGDIISTGKAIGEFFNDYVTTMAKIHADESKPRDKLKEIDRELLELPRQTQTTNELVIKPETFDGVRPKLSVVIVAARSFGRRKKKWSGEYEWISYKRREEKSV